MVDALVDEALEVTAAAEELIDAFAEGSALDGALDAFVEEAALGGVVDGVVETGAGADPDEEPDAARAGTAAPARTRR